MHPRTREVRRPDSGIDPRGSGSGQPPLLQGFLRHRRPAAPPASSSAEAADAATPDPSPAAKAGASPASSAPKPRKRAAKPKA